MRSNSSDNRARNAVSVLIDRILVAFTGDADCAGVRLVAGDPGSVRRAAHVRVDVLARAAGGAEAAGGAARNRAQLQSRDAERRGAPLRRAARARAAAR